MANLKIKIVMENNKNYIFDKIRVLEIWYFWTYLTKKIIDSGNKGSVFNIGTLCHEDSDRCIHGKSTSTNQESCHHPDDDVGRISANDTSNNA